MTINIDRFIIGGDRTFIIAEIGNNHNGSFERAKLMIDKAKEMGADCVKFQMRQIQEVYRKKSLDKSGEDLGTEYVIDLLKKFELTVEQQRELVNYCQQKDILYLCTPWDAKSVDILESFHVAAYKVSSADLTNLPLLDKLSVTQKPLILSTGMSTVEEIKFSVSYLKERKVKFVVLHCNSTYPAPLQDINLLWLTRLQQIHSLIGYSGHERGTAVSLAAVALGAKVIERHFTLDRQMEGPDHAASLEFNDFSNLITGIREIEKALGSSEDERVFSQGEMINRENLGKSLVSATKLPAGHLLTTCDIKVMSPGQGLSPQYFQKLVGKQLKRNMSEEDFFFASDLEDKRHKPRDYKFRRWGVPVRYHDFNKYRELINPDLYEFHLSYSDMELHPDEFLGDNKYNEGFVVHAPELFRGSHLMDLATPDINYRLRSMNETQRVIDLTRSLKKFFPNEKKPLIVANIGGFSMDEPLSKNVIDAYYERFFYSLNELDTGGVEIIPQTMAPFPWHFGGQRHQNIFVKADEIEKYCQRYDLRICFDVSHSMLTCNYFELDFYEFAKKVAPFTAHIHLGDAKGLNGEGLQIGEGEIDFVRLFDILDRYCPDAGFIPEIWQGHKNEGEGFWLALEKLESFYLRQEV